MASLTKNATDNQNVQLAVEKKLDHKDISNGTGPWVEVDNGVVILTGRVKSVWGKNEAIKRALEVKGVDTVQDKLEIAYGESDKKVADLSFPFASPAAHGSINTTHITKLTPTIFWSIPLPRSRRILSFFLCFFLFP